MSTLQDDLDILDPEIEVQKAYDNAVKSNWTIARHSCAMSIFNIDILGGVFSPQLKGLQEKGTYPNIIKDVVVVGWLLSLSPEQVIHINANAKPADVEKYLAEAYEWAEKEGIRYGSKRYLDSVKQLVEIVGSIFTAFYDLPPTTKREPQKKIVTAPLGKSNSVTMPSKRQGKRKVTSKTI